MCVRRTLRGTHHRDVSHSVLPTRCSEEAHMEFFEMHKITDGDVEAWALPDCRLHRIQRDFPGTWRIYKATRYDARTDDIPPQHRACQGTRHLHEDAIASNRHTNSTYQQGYHDVEQEQFILIKPDYLFVTGRWHTSNRNTTYPSI